MNIEASLSSKHYENYCFYNQLKFVKVSIRLQIRRSWGLSCFGLAVNWGFNPRLIRWQIFIHELVSILASLPAYLYFLYVFVSLIQTDLDLVIPTSIYDFSRTWFGFPLFHTQLIRILVSPLLLLSRPPLIETFKFPTYLRSLRSISRVEFQKLVSIITLFWIELTNNFSQISIFPNFRK